MIRPKRKTAPLLWTDEMIHAVVTTADDMGRHSIGTAVMLNAWFGQREGDILALRSDSLQDGEIRVTQSKTGATAPIPVAMVPHLLERFHQEAARQEDRRRRQAIVAVDFANASATPTAT